MILPDDDFDHSLAELEADWKRAERHAEKQFRPFQQVIDQINIQQVVSLLKGIRTITLVIAVITIAIALKLFGFI